MAEVVLIHEDPDVRQFIELAIRKTLPDDTKFASFDAYDAAACEAIAAQDCKLAVLGATATAEHGRRQTHPHQSIRKLLPGMLEANTDLNFAVLATRPDDELANLVRLHEKGVLLTIRAAASWLDELNRFAAASFGNQPAEDARRTRTVINISMPGAKGAIWTIERRGRIQVPEYGLLALDEGELEDLRDDGRKLASLGAGHPERRTHLIKTGNRMYREIFGRTPNTPLISAFTRARNEHGADRIRIVFDLPGDQHELPVETLKEKGSETLMGSWYALSASILRKYQSNGRLEPLFRDKASRTGKLNVLLIAADPDGGWQELKPLTHVEKEVTDLHALLSKIDNIDAEPVFLKKWREELPADSDPETVHYHLRQKLCDKLKERPWNIVHFAGHSFIEPANPQLGIREEAQLALSVQVRAAMPFSDFVALLPATQLLFLSSCQSGNLAFLRRAMAESIPAILGYVWPVSDIGAYHMAMAYYSALFLPGTDAHQSLGRAMSRARSKAFGVHWDWSSPVLLTSQDESNARLDAMARDALNANPGPNP